MQNSLSSHKKILERYFPSVTNKSPCFKLSLKRCLQLTSHIRGLWDMGCDWWTPSLRGREIQNSWDHSMWLTRPPAAEDWWAQPLNQESPVSPLHHCMIPWPGSVEWHHLSSHFFHFMGGLECTAWIYIVQSKNDAFLNVTVCRENHNSSQNRNEARLLGVDSNQSHFSRLLMLTQVLCCY